MAVERRQDVEPDVQAGRRSDPAQGLQQRGVAAVRRRS
jgi:hypothetical protein